MIKKPKICIIGSGVIGQATGRGFLSKGFEVLFIDIDPIIIAKLRKEGLLVYNPSKLENGKCDCDVVMITVPTPTINGKTDLGYMQAAAKDLGVHLTQSQKYHLTVVRSTVIPGTTESLVIKTIEKFSGKKIGEDFGVCVNPEYLREKTATEDFANPWAIVIGEYDQKSGDILNQLYADFDAPTYRVSIAEAEMQKYIHNLFNAFKITFFNEMREVINKTGIIADNIFPLVAKSAEGMWNPSYGIKNLGPFDGSCLPKDAQAFLTWAKWNGIDVSLLETTIKINQSLSQMVDQEATVEEEILGDGLVASSTALFDIQND